MEGWHGQCWGEEQGQGCEGACEQRGSGVWGSGPRLGLDGVASCVHVAWIVAWTAGACEEGPCQEVQATAKRQETVVVRGVGLGEGGRGSRAVVLGTEGAAVVTCAVGGCTSDELAGACLEQTTGCLLGERVDRQEVLVEGACGSGGVGRVGVVPSVVPCAVVVPCSAVVPCAWAVVAPA